MKDALIDRRSVTNINSLLASGEGRAKHAAVFGGSKGVCGWHRRGRTQGTCNGHRCGCIDKSGYGGRTERLEGQSECSHQDRRHLRCCVRTVRDSPSSVVSGDVRTNHYQERGAGLVWNHTSIRELDAGPHRQDGCSYAAPSLLHARTSPQGGRPRIRRKLRRCRRAGVGATLPWALSIRRLNANEVTR